MSRGYLSAGITALAALLLASTAYAQNGHGQSADPVPDETPELWSRLDLTRAQQARIRALRAEARQAEAEVREEARQTRARLRAAWRSDQRDEAALLAEYAELQPLRQRLRVLREELRIAIAEILSHDQRAQLAALEAAEGAGTGR